MNLPIYMKQTQHISTFLLMCRSTMNVKSTTHPNTSPQVLAHHEYQVKQDPLTDWCYFLCRLWTPIDGEFDDYIVNPKPSGYQVRFSFVFTMKDKRCSYNFLATGFSFTF